MEGITIPGARGAMVATTVATTEAHIGVVTTMAFTMAIIMAAMTITEITIAMVEWITDTTTDIQGLLT